MKSEHLTIWAPVTPEEFFDAPIIAAFHHLHVDKQLGDIEDTGGRTEVTWKLKREWTLDELGIFGFDTDLCLLNNKDGIVLEVV